VMYVIITNDAVNEVETELVLFNRTSSVHSRSTQYNTVSGLSINTLY
jgi:hypothetical protein